MENPYFLLLLEYYPNGSLDKYIWDPEKRKVLTPTVIAKIILGVAAGLDYMHKCGSYHRDVPADHILLDENWEPKITVLEEIGFESMPRTLFFISPRNLKYGHLVGEFDEMRSCCFRDMFSYSLVVWELITEKDACLEYPHWNPERPNYRAFATAMGQGWRPDSRRIEQQWLRSLIDYGWAHDPHERPTFSEFIEKMEAYDYMVMDGVESNEVGRYHEMLKEAELAFPPKPIPSDMMITA